MTDANENLEVNETEETTVEKEKEFVKTGEEYTEAEVYTGVQSIKFKVAAGNITDLAEKFKNITDLEVTGEDKQVYGIYKNLKFVSAAVDAEGNVLVSMVIASETEKRLKALEDGQEELNKSQEVQNEALDDIIGIVGGEE